ncbi:DUF732 domain-containing protein [Mycobacteroides abscessus]|uniref:DUF732 domain-containing protein n=1 Tax=Mycobacteroides abscessus TaxID=36809 RepID=UPI0012ABA758|nr:DUF732 domain-containing protein [Mycobacteroides abscessus]
MAAAAASAETGVSGTADHEAAWSRADEYEMEAFTDDTGRRNWLISGVIFTATLALAGLAALGAYVFLGERHAKPTVTSLPAAAAPSAPPVSTPTSTTPSASLLNGKYEILHDWAHATYRGNERKGGGQVKWDTSGMSDKTWAAFATTCTETDCIATVTGYNPDGTLATGHGVMRLDNGTWIDMTPTRTQQQCVNIKSGEVEGTAWWTSRWSFTPRPDGTLHGEHVTSVDSDECGDKGNTQVVPITLTRVGDVTASSAPRSTTYYDQMMVDALRAKGWNIPDGMPAAAAARRICQMLVDGKTVEQAAQIYAQQNGNPVDASRTFVQVVTQTYPNCP